MEKEVGQATPHLKKERTDVVEEETNTINDKMDYLNEIIKVAWRRAIELGFETDIPSTDLDVFT